MELLQSCTKPSICACAAVQFLIIGIYPATSTWRHVRTVCNQISTVYLMSLSSHVSYGEHLTIAADNWLYRKTLMHANPYSNI